MANADDDAVAHAASAVRALQEAYSRSAAPNEVLLQVAGYAAAAADALIPYPAGEGERDAGGRRELPGYGQLLVPVVTYLESTDDQMAATVACGAMYLGSRGAVHGGVVPLLFDDVFGRLVNRRHPGTRTAYLTVNYRRPTPVDGQLCITGRIDRSERRKRWLSGELFRVGEPDVLAEAEGLFVVPRPG